MNENELIDRTTAAMAKVGEISRLLREVRSLCDPETTYEMIARMAIGHTEREDKLANEAFARRFGVYNHVKRTRR